MFDLHLPSPILADGVGSLIGIVFVVLMILSWIMQLIGGANRQQQQRPANRGRQQPPRPQPRRPQDEKLQKEIDVFLNEVGGRDAGKGAKAEDVPIEIVPEEERQGRTATAPGRQTARGQQTGQRQPAGQRPQRAQRPRVGQRQRAGQQQGQRPQTPRRPAQAPAQQREPARPRRVAQAEPAAEQEPLQDHHLESNVSRHVSDYMQKHELRPQTGERLGRRIGESGEQKRGLGTSAASQAAGEGRRTASQGRHRMFQLLRNRQGLRQAMMLNTILSAPPGLRGGASETTPPSRS